MKRVVLWTFGVAVVLVLAFTLLNFRIMSSRTAHDSGVASSYPTLPGQEQLLVSRPTVLKVEGDGRLNQTLEADLVEVLRSVPNLAPVSESSVTAATASGAPAIIVKVQEQNVFWTPVYARATVKVQVSYSTNGDVSFRESDPPHFVSRTDAPAFQLLGTYTMADVSRGLVSLPGYQEFLSEQMAKSICDSLQNELKRSLGPAAVGQTPG